MSENPHGQVPGSLFQKVSPPIAPATPPPQPAEPSWGQVLATTIGLWLARRRHVAARRWRPAALILVLAIAAAAGSVFAGLFAPATSPAPRASSSGSARAPRPSAAAVAQARAAAWITGQVSSDAIVGCDPALCAALQAHGVVAGILMPLQPGSPGPPSADVIVTSVSTSSQLTAAYAPDVIARFGSGRSRIDVRVVARDGAAAYESALRADLAARIGAGAQLLQNSRIHFGARAAAQVRLGAVDSRLLATLAALSSLSALHVTAFDDASPGARTLLREVTITAGPGPGSAGLGAVLTAVKAQNAPYLPDHAVLTRIAGGHPALRVEFAAPSPLGLLTTVLADSPQRA